MKAIFILQLKNVFSKPSDSTFGNFISCYQTECNRENIFRRYFKSNILKINKKLRKCLLIVYANLIYLTYLLRHKVNDDFF